MWIRSGRWTLFEVKEKQPAKLWSRENSGREYKSWKKRKEKMEINGLEEELYNKKKFDQFQKIKYL